MQIVMNGITTLSALVIILCFCGCSGPEELEDSYIRVNEYRASRDEINSLFKFETELDSNFYSSEDTRKDFIQNLIQTQLLIQEARRRNLDQQEKFRKSIQLHWESTLIRDLLAEKTEELRKSTIVSEEEAQLYYEQNNNGAKDITFDSVRDEIVSLLAEEKLTKRLDEWISGLKEKAEIVIQKD